MSTSRLATSASVRCARVPRVPAVVASAEALLVVDVGVAVSINSASVSVGGSLTYTATVTNSSATTAASAVTLFIQPSAGVSIAGTSFASSQGSCDAAVNVCSLGSLQAGETATVSVQGVLAISGCWPVTFSVTHADADSVPSNDSAAAVALAQ